MKKFAAFCVHLFTASGIVAGFYAIVATSEGNLVKAMWLLFLCQFIDGIDGTFARIFKVKETLPGMDGKTIDYVVDFCTYAVIPAYMLYMSAALPESCKDLSVVSILLVSAIYYGMSGMVTESMNFVGFPVMWNFAAFVIIFVVPPDWAWFNFVLVMILCVLHFVPIQFAYPSRSKRFFLPHLLVTVLFLVTAVAILWFYPAPIWMGLVLATCVAYYLGMGIYEWQIDQGKRL